MCAPKIYTLPTIDFVGGSTQELSFHCYSVTDKSVFDLSSCEANFSMTSYVNKNSGPVVSKAMRIQAANGSGQNIPNVLSVTLDPSDTVDLVGKFIYQITVKDGVGSVDIPNQGIVYIANNIDKLFVKR